MTCNIYPHDPGALRVERDLIVGYAPAPARAGFAALLALDERLGSILRSTREPLVGQMRLTWWYEALIRLDGEAAPAEPVLGALATTVLPGGVTGADLATLIDGWEVLLEAERVDAPVMLRHAEARGARLFGLAARLSGAVADDAVVVAGAGWALADLGGNLSDPDGRALAVSLADERLTTAFASRWPRPLRALGALALAARLDHARPVRAPGDPRRTLRLLRHRITGW